MLDAEEIEALGKASKSTIPSTAVPRMRPFQIGRSDQDLSRAAAFLDIHVPTIFKRVRESLRHESGRQVTIADATPRLLPTQDLLLGEGAASLVVVDVGAGVGLPSGLLIMNLPSARAMALMAIASSTSTLSDTPRPLSMTERRLLARCLSGILKAFERGLPADTPLLPLRLNRIYNDPRELTGIDLNAPMVNLPLGFDGDVSARIELVAPSSWLILGRSHGLPRPNASGRRLGQDHSQVMLEVSAELGRARVSLRKLLHLSPGEIVTLHASQHALVPVLIQGRRKLSARPEVREGRVAMVIATDPDATGTAANHPNTSAPRRAPRPLYPENRAMADAEIDNARLQTLLDVEMDVAVEIGRTRLSLEQVLALEEGAAIPLEKAAGDPLDIYVNGRLVARGEAVIVGDLLGFRVTEIVGRPDRSGR